jgi:hypothetical protein
MTSIARIVQVSDFHFTAKLTNKGRAYYKELFQFAKAKGHAVDKLTSLHRQMEKLEREEGEPARLH